MVGPRGIEWNVLRTTDGERFVAKIKSHVFQADRELMKGGFEAKPSSLMIKILLYVIMYPLATELFALFQMEIDDTIQNNFSSFIVGPP